MSNINLNDCEDFSLPIVNIALSCTQLPEKNAIDFIKLAVSKVSVGGRFIMQGIDIYSVMKDILYYDYSYDILLDRKSMISIKHVRNLLSSLGLSVVSIDINDSGIYTIEAQR